MKTKRESLVATALGVAVLLCGLSSKPAFADACRSANLADIIGTTCNIGHVEFTFQDFYSQNFAFDSDTGTYLYNTPWSASDFYFVPFWPFWQGGLGFELLFGGGLSTSKRRPTVTPPIWRNWITGYMSRTLPLTT